MSALTEIEIIECLRDSLSSAIEHCDALAVLAQRGPTYDALRKELQLIEGACRQMGYWRGDTRWMALGLQMEEAHKRAGDWLRRHHPRPLFVKLAENLRGLLKLSHDLHTKATGVRGPILPAVLEGPIRQGRPVQVRTPGGIIIPDGVRV